MACDFPELYVYNKNNKDKSLMKDTDRKLKGVSKTVVQNQINHENYMQVLKDNEPIRRDVESIRSFNHQLYSYKTNKVALTSFYDKMEMVDEIKNVPYGYKKKQ